MKKGISIGEHLNDYTKHLADLLNVDGKVSNEDRGMILLKSLLDSYKQWCDSLIMGRNTFKYQEVDLQVD